MNNTASWPQPQEIVGKPMEEIITNNNNNNNSTTKPQPSTSLERKVRPQKEQAVNCPRCNSTNTKFCYYNNYSLTQPRYFCKTCRRYWTEGGSLRNIPVGGGSRKNKRPASSAFPSPNNSSSKMIKLPDLVPPQLITQNPNPSHKIIHHDQHQQQQQQGQDLNLGFPSTLSEFMHPSNTSALELLTGLSNSSSRGLMSPFMPMHLHQDPHSGFPSGFSLHGHGDHLKQPALHFSLDGLAADASACLQGGVQDSGIDTGRILFPFEDLKSTITTASATTPTTTTTAGDHEHHHQHHNSADQQITRDQQGDSTGYWTGILGGAGSW